MAVFKCKMCGGALNIGEQTVASCAYCGTVQTLPRLDSERRANLYDRAGHFRRNNDFDKAMEIYEQILNEDGKDAEAYWSLVLCRYGIEYVDDPASGKRIPTVNRAQFTSIYMDEDYKSAIKYADELSKRVYEAEAKVIDDIQRGILEISSKEKPFDIFICYKETDNNGRRTPDSVLANDLYHQLTEAGYKVFFSRITLEDKLGSAYEPYIFAALNSSKVMVVLGTKSEYFNAVWVKNEWSRYLSLIRNGQKKVLIPAYRDMDPYDLPEAFSHLQAQDMSKLGFMQDLIRGIRKIAGEGTGSQSVNTPSVMGAGQSDVAPLLKRAYIFLDDGNFDDARVYCEKVLDRDPENAEAYLGKLMADMQVGAKERLCDCDESFENNYNYQKAVRYGDEKLRAELAGYLSAVNERGEAMRKETAYGRATALMERAASEAEYKAASEEFGKVSEFRDSAELAAKCLELAKECRMEAIYASGRAKMQVRGGEPTAEDYQYAANIFNNIRGYKDTEELIGICYEMIDRINSEEEEAEKKSDRMRTVLIVVCSLITVVALVLSVPVAVYGIVPNMKYKDAAELIEDGKYEDAIEILEELDDYKNSEDQLRLAKGYLQLEDVMSASEGDTVEFGIDKDGNSVKWIVLDRSGGEMLLVATTIHEHKPVSDGARVIEWSNGTAASWLKSEFYNSIFLEPHHNVINSIGVPSVSEAKEFSSDSERAAGDAWWLRTKGAENGAFAYVESDGSINEYGTGQGVELGIRPAVRIRITK